MIVCLCLTENERDRAKDRDRDIEKETILNKLCSKIDDLLWEKLQQSERKLWHNKTRTQKQRSCIKVGLRSKMGLTKTQTERQTKFAWVNHTKRNNAKKLVESNNFVTDCCFLSQSLFFLKTSLFHVFSFFYVHTYSIALKLGIKHTCSYMCLS